MFSMPVHLFQQSPAIDQDDTQRPVFGDRYLCGVSIVDLFNYRTGYIAASSVGDCLSNVANNGDGGLHCKLPFVLVGELFHS